MSQPYADLVELSGYGLPVHSSKGAEVRARPIAERCQRALRFFSRTFDMEARIRALILAPAEWSHYTAYPVYGMPGYIDPETLIVASEDNGFWRTLTPPLETMTTPSAEATRAAFGLPDGSVDYAPFFDLLAVHEIAHLFHEQAGIQFPRLWLKEFFANFALHAYVSAEEPAKMGLFETYPQLVVDRGAARVTHHALADFEQLYTDMPAENYGWYQSQLLIAAKRVYDVGGIEILQRLWQAFLRPTVALSAASDERLAQYLRDEAHPTLALIMTQWPMS